MSKEGIAFIHDHNSNVGHIRNCLAILDNYITSLKVEKDVDMIKFYEDRVKEQQDKIKNTLTSLTNLADGAYKLLNNKPEQPYTT